MSLRTLSWRAGEAINRAGFAVFSDLSVTGRENVPRQGGLLLISNHVRMADIPLLAAAIPRKLTFVGKRELWDKLVFKTIGTWYDCFPVDRATADTGALKRSLRVIREGGALVIFPEGTRSPDGRLQRGFPGSALIALYQDATVLPVALTGTNTADGARWLWRHPRLTVNIGKPFKLERPPGEPVKNLLAPATENMMRRIAELLPEGLRGEYGK